MHRRRRGRTMQGMLSPQDSLRESYEMGRDFGTGRRGRNKVTVGAPSYSYSSIYKKDT